MQHNNIPVPKSPRVLLSWLWPDRFKTSASPSQENNISQKDSPQPRVDSNNSTLSTDSYLDELRPLDLKFRQLCEDILILDTGRDILQERKMLSHQAKKRKRLLILTANWRRARGQAIVGGGSWTPAMETEYAIYKAKVAAIAHARKQAETARRIAENSTRRGEDVTLREMKLCHAMDYHQVWFDTAIERANIAAPDYLHAEYLAKNQVTNFNYRAAKARIEFMHKYNSLGCFTTSGDKGHLDAAKSNLNSAKNAVRKLEAQREELRKLRAKRDLEVRWRILRDNNTGAKPAPAA